MCYVSVIDPSHVIGLYPNLLPQDFLKQLEYSDRLPDLQGVELERGLMVLIEYLTEVRLDPYVVSTEQYDIFSMYL